jgi:F-type H+-transporting ATPase subunit delta
MIVSHIAVPYAKALFDLTVERNLLEETMKDMQVVAALYEKNKDFRMMLKSPVISEGKKRIIFSRIFEKTLSKLTFTFLLIIVRKKRESFIGDIAFAFIELYKEYKGILTTTLKTAIPVSDDIRERISSLMKTQSRGEIELVEEVNAELIGGFILQWNDKQYNASIQKQISRLQRGVTRVNLYKKGY